MRVFNRPSTRPKRKNLRSSQTEAETVLWERLRDRGFMGYKFYRQYGIGEYIADFYCPQQRLVIEIDGGQHHTGEVREYDDSREKFMSSLAIKTIRFSNRDVLQNIERVMAEIAKDM